MSPTVEESTLASSSQRGCRGGVGTHGCGDRFGSTPNERLGVLTLYLLKGRGVKWGRGNLQGKES